MKKIKFVPQICLLSVLTVIIVCVYFLSENASGFSKIDKVFFDIVSGIRGEIQANPKIKVLIYDTEAISNYKLPMPLYLHTKIIQDLDEMGAKIIAPCYIFSDLERELIFLSRNESDLYNFVDTLINSKKVILPYFIDKRSKSNSIEMPPFMEKFAINDPNLTEQRAYGFPQTSLMFSEHILGEHAIGQGFLTPSLSRLGLDATYILQRQGATKSRRHSLLFMSYPLNLALAFSDINPEEMKFTKGGVAFGDLLMPLDESGLFMINYLRPNMMYETFTVSDLLNGRISEDAIKDSLIIYADEQLDAMALRYNSFNGLEYRYYYNIANVVDQITGGHFLLRNNFVKSFEIILFLISVLIMSLIFRTQKLIFEIGGSFIICAAVLTINSMCFIHGFIVRPIPIVMGLILVFIGLIIFSIIGVNRLLLVSKKALQQSEEIYSLAVKAANDGLWGMDVKSGMCYASERMLTIFGMPELQKLSMESNPFLWLDYVNEEDRMRVSFAIDKYIKGETSSFGEEFRINIDNSKDAITATKWIYARGNVIKDDSGNAIRIAIAMSDITARKKFEHDLMQQTLHDSFTGLPNKVLFLDRAKQIIKQRQVDRLSDCLCAVIRVDNLNRMNLAYGSNVTDQIVLLIARRLEHIITTHDTVAILGSNDFCFLKSARKDIGEDTERELLLKLKSILWDEFDIGNTKFPITTCIGYSILSRYFVQNAEELLRNSTLALYAARDNGQKQCLSFSPALIQNNIQYHLERDLQHTLASPKDSLFLYYQPIVDLKHNRVAGFEALIRWLHPSLGMIPPGQFIPMAENSGLIDLVSIFCLDEAFSQLKKWKEMNLHCFVSINLSGKQISTMNLDATVKDYLKTFDVDPSLVKLEITETAIMHRPEIAHHVLNNIRNLGISISIDDFGIGYSSLSKLQDIPFDTLKIDRSFVTKMHESLRSYELISIISNITQSLGRTSVAEGIEDLEQLESVKKLNIDYGQGFYFSKPLPVDDATSFLQNYSQMKYIIKAIDHQINI